MTHGRQRSRNLDGTILKKEATDLAAEHKRLDELGQGYLADKKKIEDEIEHVENANISAEDKAKLKKKLEVAMDTVVEQYSTEIEEAQHRIEEEMDSLLDEAEEAAKEKEHVSAAFGGGNGSDGGDSGALNLSDAAEEARKQEQEFKEIYSNQAERIKLQMQQSELQRREMRKKQLGGH